MFARVAGGLGPGYDLMTIDLWASWALDAHPQMDFYSQLVASYLFSLWTCNIPIHSFIHVTETIEL